MKICEKGHDIIVYKAISACPLCHLIKHNNTVHDFIESKGKELVKELVEYQKKENKDNE